MKLFHCSDIQLRPLKRHDEFKSVFNKFYDSLIEQGAYNDDSIIVVCGDIIQEKDKLKPELIMIMRSFFKKLVLISKCVVVICGNHDLLEHNKERLDNLTPILADIKGIHYLRTTGEYLVKGVLFVVNSIVDGGFIKDVVGHENAKSVGLYHGMINGCIFDNGMVVSGNKYNVKDFDNYDYVLLGDIHKHQYMDDKKRIAYSGSLVQQNFGEDYRGHGYIIWDLESGNSQFIEINSDYGFYNIKEVVDVALIKSKYAYVRYHINDRTDRTDRTDESELKSLVEQKCTVLREEIRIITGDDDDSENFDFIEQCQNDDIKVFQKQLEKRNIVGAVYDDIVKYHKDLKETLDITEGYGTGGYWTIDSLEFQNMLIYGGGHVNKITFKNGVTSICGDNAIGKSCILKLVIFTLFDKTCSNDKNSIINKKEKKCYVELKFSFSGNGGKRYCIKREGRLHKNKGKNEMKFHNTLTENDLCINLEHGKKTMEELRRFLGGYEDFIMTNVFSHSYNDVSLLKITDKARLDIFIRYFKLDMYKILQDKCKKELKDLDSQWNYLRGSISDAPDVVENSTDKIKKLRAKNRKVIGDSTINENKYNEIKNMKTVKCLDETRTLASELAIMKSKINEDDNDSDWTDNDEKQLKDLWFESEIKEETFYGDIPFDSIDEIDKELENYCEPEVISESLFDLKMQIIDIGDELTWEPEDENNLVELWDDRFTGLDIAKARVWEDSVEINSREHDEINERNKIIKAFLGGSDNSDDICHVLERELDGYYDEIRERIWKSGGKLGADYKQFIQWYDLNEVKQEIFDNSGIHETNKELAQKIVIIEKNIKYNELIQMKKYMVYQRYRQWKELNSKHEQVLLRIAVSEMESQLRYVQINDYESNMGVIAINREIEELERQSEVSLKVAKIRLEIVAIESRRDMLDIYKSIVDKGGIPKDILSDNISGIVVMINRFLKQFVGFTLEVNIDGDRFEMFVMKCGVRLSIGDLSGYESFILNIGFKNALLKLSMINKCGCLFIDEGLDCIDGGNFDRLGDVFDGLGKVFGKIIVITHIEEIRRFEQCCIQIIRETGGNSRIKN